MFFQQDAGGMPRKCRPRREGGALPEERLGRLRDHLDLEQTQLERSGILIQLLNSI